MNRVSLQIIIFIFLSSTGLKAQLDSLVFLGLEPEWVLIQEDENNTSDDPNIDRYKSILNSEIFKVGDKTYILNHVRSDRHIFHGGILTHVDVNNGEVIWKTPFTVYSEDSLKSEYINNIFIENDTLKLLGKRIPYESSSFIWPSGFQPSVRYLDNNTGEKLGHMYQETDSVFLYSENDLGLYLKNENEKLFFIQNTGLASIQFDSSYLQILLTKIDSKNLNVYQEIRDTLIYVPEEPTYAFSFAQYHPMRTLNDSCFVLWVNQDNQQDSLKDAELLWLTIDDSKIKINQRRKIKDIVELTQLNNPFRSMEVKNEEIFIQEAYVDESDEVSYWFAWLDRFGNTKTKINRLEKNGRKYFKIFHVRHTDTKAIFLARYQETKSGFDVISIDTEGNIEVLETINVSNRASFFCQNVTQNNKLVNDSSLLITVATDYEEYIVAFNTNKLGIGTTTKTQENKKIDLSVIPNPVSDVLNIVSEEVLIKLDLYDLQGKLVLSNITKKQIDVSALPTGTYILKAETNKGLRTVKLVKK